MKKIIVLDLMKTYPEDNKQGIIIMSSDKVSFIDLLDIPFTAMICKLHKQGKYNTRLLADRLNEEINVTITLN